MNRVSAREILENLGILVDDGCGSGSLDRGWVGEWDWVLGYDGDLTKVIFLYLFIQRWRSGYGDGDGGFGDGF